MKATPGQQRLLLDLQDYDTAAARLRRRLASLPEREQLVSTDPEHRAAKESMLEAQRQVDLQTADIARLESDAETVRARRERDVTLLAASSSPKEAQALNSEIEHLERRQAELEDRELELMLENETALEELNRATSTLLEIEERRRTLAQRISDAESEIHAQLVEIAQQREGLAVEVQRDLLGLYEETRERTGIGAARLRGNVSEGSNMALAPAELSNIRQAAADEVVFCPGSGAILIRDEPDSDEPGSHES